MKGQVHHVNRLRGMYSILNEAGNFVVIESSEELREGETVKLSLSSETIKTENGKFDCIVQDNDCNELTARKKCFL